MLGAVIGVNTAILSGANGIGFAIPADRAKRVVDDLLRFGALQPLWTGLRLLTVDPELARRYELPAPAARSSTASGRARQPPPPVCAKRTSSPPPPAARSPPART